MTHNVWPADEYQDVYDSAWRNLERLKEALDLLILATPTGEKRNKLTEANIQAGLVGMALNEARP